MNERIKELMKEANKNIPIGKPFWPALEEFSEKFAELIVRECAEIANDHNSEVEGVTLGVGRALKQHFGVEE
jgi:hypothetical protein